MPYLVKAFDTVAQSWVKWSVSSLSRAFYEYPGEAQGYPPVVNLSEKVRVVRSVSGGSFDGVSGAASSLWELVNGELVFGFHIEGHTGNWAISIEQELVEDPTQIDLGFVIEENGERVPQLGGTPLYLEMLEVYPNLIGLSDTFWSANGNDLVLGV